jgi:hypothetical protein
MSATVYALTAEVREAALDVKAVQRRIRDAGSRVHEWRPAEARARARMVAISREQGRDQTNPAHVSGLRPEQSAPAPFRGPSPE